MITLRGGYDEITELLRMGSCRVKLLVDENRLFAHKDQLHSGKFRILGDTIISIEFFVIDLCYSGVCDELKAR